MSVRFLLGMSWSVLAIGCASTGFHTVESAGPACALFDSLYHHSGFENPVIVRGKATIDAEQYRVRGKVRLEVTPRGDVSLDFSSSVLFGARREDFFFSMVGDTVRVIDRERGRYYDARDSDRFLREVLAMDFDPREPIGLALGRPPSCEEFNGLRVEKRSSGETRFSGNVGGAPFRIVFSDDFKLKEITWPLVMADHTRDRLRVSYAWTPDGNGRFRLREVVIWLEARDWRCKIVSAT